MPVNVKNFLNNPSKYKKISPEEYNLGVKDLVCLDGDNLFELEIIETKVGPWIYCLKLIDLKKKLTYKIEQGTPFPYIIYEDKLYIADRYNLFTAVKNLNDIEFTCYSLK